jgi:hypothetical protein
MNKLADFLEKLSSDQNLLINEFESFLFGSQLDSCLKAFEDMSEFLENSSLSIL